jgi:hypothetical protein
MKNEEKNIVRFLEALKDLDVEIVLVDTGSTDRTVELVSGYDVNLYSYEWKNDFSDARNFCISKASNDNVLILDCDEFVKSFDNSALLKQIEEMPDHIGIIKIINLIQADTEKGAYFDNIPRIFNRTIYHFEGKIHEQICFIDQNSKTLQGYYAPVEIIHTGYIMDADVAEVKRQRNISMISSELEKDFSNPYLHFQLAQEYYNQGSYEEALKEFSFVLENDELKRDVEYHRLSVMGYFDCLLHTDQEKKAHEEYGRYIDKFGYTPDFHYLSGVICYLNKDFLKALQELVIATTMNNPKKEGTNTYLPWYYIGLINEQFGNYKDAVAFYEKCLPDEKAEERIKCIRERSAL